MGALLLVYFSEATLPQMQSSLGVNASADNGLSEQHEGSTNLHSTSCPTQADCWSRGVCVQAIW